MPNPLQYACIDKVNEDITHEFKTSLFYECKTSMPSDEQMGVITRTIASMMNKDGGTIYVGVNDRGYATNSITEEYRYLNEFSPYPKNIYPENRDGYKRFILDWIAKELGNFATTLISFDFDRLNDIEICKINIQKSGTPIWFRLTSLYVRADASSRQLRGNDITSFIMQIDKDTFINATKSDQAAFEKRLAEIKTKEIPSDNILVVYPNGDYIHENKDVETLLSVIHKAGIEEVKNLGLTGLKGRCNTPYVPFIGTTVYKEKTQRELDGYLVFVKTSTAEKIARLTEISNGLGLNLHIERY